MPTYKPFETYSSTDVCFGSERITSARAGQQRIEGAYIMARAWNALAYGSSPRDEDACALAFDLVRLNRGQRKLVTHPAIRLQAVTQ